MRIPDFVRLREERSECQKRGQRYRISSYAQGVHPNPKFYKYYWWVFWNESAIDGEEFLTDQYRLTTAAAIQLMDDLRERNETCWVYNTKLPRLDPANPFDLTSRRWQGANWVPPYDADPDPIAEGKGLGQK